MQGHAPPAPLLDIRGLKTHFATDDGVVQAVDGVDIAINRDFIDATLDPQTLTALLKSYISGAISLDTFLFNLRQAEMMDPARSIKDEIASLPKLPALKTETEEVID